MDMTRGTLLLGVVPVVGFSKGDFGGAETFPKPLLAIRVSNGRPCFGFQARLRTRAFLPDLEVMLGYNSNESGEHISMAGCCADRGGSPST